jgi:hypothetical protein
VANKKEEELLLFLCNCAGTFGNSNDERQGAGDTSPSCTVRLEC